jgi:ribosomal-protein-alanine N-acetyltransferase
LLEGAKGRWFTIRKASVEDIPSVIRINLESLPENYWYGFYVQTLENWGEAFLVAEAGGQIVGYAMSRVEESRDPVLLGLATELGSERGVGQRIVDLVKSILQESRPVGHLISIAVAPGFRGRGVGAGLLSETIRVLRDHYRVESIYLEVRVSNAPAIRLYEKFGFRRARIVKGYYRDGEDAYVYVKRLVE